MRNVFTALVLSCTLLLAACGNQVSKYVPTTVANTPAQHVFALKTQYLALIKLVEQYEVLPRCATTDKVVCSHEDVVDLIRKADDGAIEALDSAERVVRDPAATASTTNLAVESARAAVGVVKSVLGENGLLK